MAGSCSTCPTARAREIGITRLHLEQDAGKSLHDQHPSLTFVDLNRAGVGLMEIVSEPDLSSAEEAGLYLRKLRSILRYLGTCDGNMEEGSLRCDANVSVRRPGEPYGTRCEIKNFNSVRYVMQAIEYEARRQVELLEEGGQVAQQTRLYRCRVAASPGRCAQRKRRTTTAISPTPICCLWCSTVTGSRGCAPGCRNCRMRKRRGSSRRSGCRPRMRRCWSPSRRRHCFSSRSPRAATPRPRRTGSPATCLRALNRLGIGIEQSPVSPEQLGALIDLIADGTISGRLAKDVFAEMVATGADPAAIVEKKGCARSPTKARSPPRSTQSSPREADKVAEYRAGRDKLYGFFVGQIMRATQGKANPALVNELLKGKLAG